MENAKRNGEDRQDVAKPARSIDLSTVTGLVHHTHPPTAELLHNAVVRNGLADQFDTSSPRAAMLGWMNRQVNAGSFETAFIADKSLRPRRSVVQLTEP